MYYYYAIAEKQKYSEPANKLLNELLDVQTMLQSQSAASQQQVDNAYAHLSTTFGEGRYFVQIAGGAVKVNGDSKITIADANAVVNIYLNKK